MKQWVSLCYELSETSGRDGQKQDWPDENTGTQGYCLFVYVYDELNRNKQVVNLASVLYPETVHSKI